MAFNKYLRMHNDLDMPAFGFRTAEIKEDDIIESLSEAIEAGYRLIETSPAYNNQGTVGDVLAAWINSNKIKRDEIFVVTKLPVENNRPHEVEEVLTKSLRLLQLEYVDLYLIDAPFAVKMEHQTIKRDSDGNCIFDEITDHKGVWKNMETMLHSGLTRAIGVGNFNISQIENMFSPRSTIPHVLQIEYHIYLQQPNVIDFCRKRNIVVLTYGALGAVTTAALLQAQRKSSLLGIKPDLVNVLELPEVLEIAAAHKKSAAHVILRWIIDKKLALTIKSDDTSRIRANINIFDFKLTQDEIEKLNALDKNMRFVDFSNYKGVQIHPDYPF
ncbi:aldo-keto reductase family 1 member A1-like [Eurosta solidaginis]|uniref:aldo-keto reductase family 1 member A1-like n=1 Tax=Eurosta solidaginis TaxID=178769 RepID=UPI00353083E5